MKITDVKVGQEVAVERSAGKGGTRRYNKQAVVVAIGEFENTVAASAGSWRTKVVTTKGVQVRYTAQGTGSLSSMDGEVEWTLARYLAPWGQIVAQQQRNAQAASSAAMLRERRAAAATDLRKLTADLGMAGTYVSAYDKMDLLTVQAMVVALLRRDDAARIAGVQFLAALEAQATANV